MLNILIDSSSNTLFKRFINFNSTLSSMALTLEYSAKSFEGEQRFYSHYSDTVKCKMNLAVYLPPKAIKEKLDCPVLYFLNGLTGTHENFVRKSGFQKFAAQCGICVVSPDTSPRDVDVPKHEFLGPGASFYLDAIQEPWANHYKMYSYVTKELIELVSTNLPVIKGRQSVSGFSMGGFGALNCFLKNPELYQSISVFAPLCNPMECKVGIDVLKTYIGNDTDEWKKWDPCVLAANYSANPIEILIDQGACDEYIEGKHLLPENFICSSAMNDCVKTTYKEREGYNHSHYYVSTFVEEHINYHAKYLNSE